MIVGGRILLKPFLRNVCYKFYSYLELPAYSYKDYCQQYPPTTKHYTKAYRLPPLSSSGSSAASSFNDDDNDEVSDDGNVFVNGLDREKKHPNGDNDRNLRSSSSGRKSRTSLRASYKRVECRAGAVHFEQKAEDSGSDADEDEDAEGSVDSTTDAVDDLPYDVDIPSRFVVYSLLGWILGEGAPAVFDLVGI